MSQSQPLRIESPDYACFTTSRCINSALWFVNNNALQQRILGCTAKYQEKYGVRLYALSFEGSHIHHTAHFNEGTRAPFYRDLNARTAEAVRYLCPQFLGGPLFERRYAEQAVPTNEDILDQFFYTVLQPVQDGLCERISDYPGYNCFHDASLGITREFEVVDWARFNAARRSNPQAKKSDYTTVHKLTYERLPGFEHLSKQEYRNMMLQELEKRRAEIVAKHKAAGRTFLTRDELLKVVPGTLAKSPKKSTRHCKRPLVLTRCPLARKNYLDWYFSVYERYKNAVKRYLAGDATAKFPPGTYKPPGPFVPTPA